MISNTCAVRNNLFRRLARDTIVALGQRKVGRGPGREEQELRGGRSQPQGSGESTFL